MISEYLDENKTGIVVHNPRGKSKHEIECIIKTIAVLLKSVDPGGFLYDEEIKNIELKKSIDRQDDFIENAINSDGEYLVDFINKYNKIINYALENNSEEEKEEVSIIEIVYGILPWIPELYDEIDGLSYCELITRVISQHSIVDRFKTKILVSKNEKEYQKSLKNMYYGVILPLMGPKSKINEDLYKTIPQENLLNIMTIHQSKGLEFPITIVDVSSDFKRNHNMQRKMRYPKEYDDVSTIENFLRKMIPDIDWGDRSGLDPLFDDLIRKYFVAFSRAQDILILVGTKTSISKKIKCISLGWDRDENWKFESNYKNSKIVMLRSQNDTD